MAAPAEGDHVEDDSTHDGENCIRNMWSEVVTVATDETGGAKPASRGLVAVAVMGIILGLVLPHNTDHLNGTVYPYVSSMIGYTYFVAWSLSFYPQLVTNFRRHDTQGLSIDFCYLNLVGFFCYSAFTCCFYWSTTLQEQYSKLHDGQFIKVQANDVAFALHAFILCFLWVVQIWMYNERLVDRIPSKVSNVFLATMMAIAAIYAGIIVVYGNTIDGKSRRNWLDLLYLLADFKVLITICKYTPQVFMNFKRKSTKGWNIWTILLDFTGGNLSILQLILDCRNTNDWEGIIGYPAKFALGFVSILFDIIFMTQHYVLYPDNDDDDGEKVSLRQSYSELADEEH